MSQTAEALAKIPFDRFERLASAVLRRANPLYQGLIHTGMNTDGQTVKSPLDGICPVPGSHPPHFIIFHYTTDERLERKWLHEQTPSGRGSRTPDGDAVKGGWLERLQVSDSLSGLAAGPPAAPGALPGAGKDGSATPLLWDRGHFPVRLTDKSHSVLADKSNLHSC